MQTNFVTLIISLLAAVNTALIAFGAYHLSNNQLEAIDKVISIVVTIGGVLLSHKQPLKDELKQLFKAS